MSARPDVFQAKEAIHQNPAGALAPVPLMGLPLLLESFGRQNSQEVHALILVIRHGCQMCRACYCVQSDSCFLSVWLLLVSLAACDLDIQNQQQMHAFGLSCQTC